MYPLKNFSNVLRLHQTNVCIVLLTLHSGPFLCYDQKLRIFVFIAAMTSLQTGVPNFPVEDISQYIGVMPKLPTLNQSDTPPVKGT